MRQLALRILMSGVICGFATHFRHAQADIVYSNFGADDSYDIHSEAIIGFLDPEVVHQAMPFTPRGNSFFLDRIEAPIHLWTGPNELDLVLAADDGGVPGEVIEAFHFSNMMGTIPVGVNPLLVADSSLNPTLIRGAQYWVVAIAVQPTYAGWNNNNTGDIGPYVFREFRGPLPHPNWTEVDGARGAFRVSGTIVPEPTSVAQVGICVVVLFFTWSRRHQATARGSPRRSAP